MNPFFSIIIPCCDVESYVNECLESVKKQSFTDWECLLVIEESKDRTEQIIRKSVEADKRFKIFTEPRSGSPATPRNTGLDHACGDYVVFLDSDDYLIGDCLSDIAAKINENSEADLYPSTFEEYNEETGKTQILDDYPMDGPSEFTGHDVFVYLDQFWLSPQVAAWRTIYRRNFLETKRLRFFPGLVHEDEEFTPRALYRASKIVPLHILFYHYRRRINSLTTSSFNGLSFLTNYGRVIKSLLAFHATVSSEPDFNHKIAPCWAKSWIGKLFIYWFSEDFVKKIPRSQRLETLKMLFSDGFDDFNILLKSSSFKRRIAGYWVKLFVRHPFWAWASELFFTKVYFPLTTRSRK